MVKKSEKKIQETIRGIETWKGICPRCGAEINEYLKEISSEKIDYKGRIYKCSECGTIVATTEWLEELILGEFNSIEEAEEAIRDAIAVQEEI